MEETVVHRQFTWRELSNLNKRHNAHVAYKGKVYNVSSFVSSHPGGVEQILTGASHDLTHIFELYHKPETEKFLEQFYVGDLVDNEMPLFKSSNDSEFYNTVRKRVDDYMKSNNIDPKIDYRMFFSYFFFVSSLWICWYLSMKFSYSILISIGFAIAWGALSGVIGLTLGHDSSHYTITHKPWVWKLFKIVTELTIGFCLYCWTYQHIYGHHKFTNIDGSDPDIVTTKNVNSVWRIKRKQPWIARYLYQHFYMPFVYTVKQLTLKIKLQDFHTMYLLKKGPVRMNSPTLIMWIEFFGTKLFHGIVRFYIPLFYMSYGKMLLLNVVYELSFGFYLAFFTQITHVNTMVEWPEPDDSNIIQSNKSWAELQVLTTTDYDTDGWLWTVLTGSLNHQIAHHLFPGVIQSHYRFITPIVRQTCQEFGVQYNCEKSITGAIYIHFKHLFDMGRKLEH